MLLVTGNLSAARFNDSAIGRPFSIDMDVPDEVAVGTVHSESFEPGEISHAVLMTDTEWQLIDHLLRNQPGDVKVPPSAKKLAEVYNYYQSHLFPARALGAKGEEALELTKVWANMEVSNDNRRKYTRSSVSNSKSR